MSARVSYRAYLLRLWRGTDTQWRASLDDPHTGERRAFATLEQLSEYLAQVTRSGFAPLDREEQVPPGKADGE